MELQEKIDRQIALAVREVVIRFSRDDVPDAANLAVALASGETAQSLAEKVKAKIDRRTAPKVVPSVTVPPAVSSWPIPPVAEEVAVKTEDAKEEVKARSHHKK